MQRWPHAHGGPLGAGDFRHTPEDFRVTELMDFVPEGHGEHQWLWIEKRGLTTDELCRELAGLCDVAPRDIGVAGLKDKQAITQQWVSVWLPGREAPEHLSEALAEKGARVLASVRHPRKLKRGVHRGNRFALRVSGEAVAHPDFETRWQTLIRDGVPNYFGPQRFGHQGHNLGRARAVLIRGWRKRDDRSGMLLSTARSFLFNEVLAARLKAGCWATALSGEVFALDGTGSRFVTDGSEAVETLTRRLADGDIHPTGPLWGTGRGESHAQVAALEQVLASSWPQLCDGLEKAGVKAERRPLRLMPANARLEWAITPTQADAEATAASAWLHFDLPRGSFATGLLRELIAHPLL
ncbi:tRNA pseudouridine(13) synthase TruD [Cobetia marina]|nr:MULTISPECIES: tRNA pseudouridine(13) synthase TruD [Cobetia]MDH2291088.1 tRNA pseudouridine(13) synthase TruD [Cobetia sp. 10Alg 146]MDI6002793.1 tRNA pseudouridine(13) synthase TruD [Cobetia pacifica]TKD63306.1 tRNA pseudouridine(13) synthase TruD [Cobetia marina]